MEVSQDLKDQLKAQRLRQLEAQYYEYSLNKVQYEAIGQTSLSEQMQKQMDDLDKQYQAVFSLDEVPTETAV